MTKSITWKNSRGNIVKLTASYEEKMVNEILNADGQVIVSKNLVNEVKANLAATLDGKLIDNCWDVSLWNVVDAKGMPFKKIEGISTIGMTAEQGKLVQEFLKSVIESGKSEEVTKHETEVMENEKAEKIKDAKEIITKAEKQTSIPTVAEYKVWARNYNNLHNEGGDGYVPKLITKEEYEYAKSILA